MQRTAPKQILGQLQLRGSFVKSNWKQRHCILTETGFLHCFTLQTQKLSDASTEYSMKDAFCSTVNLKQPGITLSLTMDHGLPSCFDITIPSSRKGIKASSTVSFKAQSDTELSSWMKNLKEVIEEHFPKGPPQPMFSSTRFF
jgi:hypothetical protein